MSRLGTLALVCLLAVAGCGEDTATMDSETKKAIMNLNDPENALLIELKDGHVVVELAPDLAPGHVTRIKELTREGFYDGIVFHRVIDGFMAQTGDPTGTGTGSSDKPNLPAEFTEASFMRGTLGMARSSNPNSANSQFFICLDAAPHLNGQYTVFGQVVEGMDHVDSIKKAPPGTDMVPDPDKMISVRVVADTQ